MSGARIGTALAVIMALFLLPLMITQMDAEVTASTATGGLAQFIDRGPLLLMVVAGLGLVLLGVGFIAWLKNRF